MTDMNVSHTPSLQHPSHVLMFMFGFHSLLATNGSEYLPTRCPSHLQCLIAFNAPDSLAHSCIFVSFDQLTARLLSAH